MESSSPPPTLATLPSAVLAKIVENLRSDDRLRLRAVSTFFANFIPQFISEDLVRIELEEWATTEELLACGGCLRLRKENCFNRLMWKEPEYYSGMYHFVEKIAYPFMNRGGALAYMRFCDDCGRRPLPGPFRYGPGEYFHEECPFRFGGSLVRCERCGKDGNPPPGNEMWPWHVYEIRRGVRHGLCADCHCAVDERSGMMDGEKRPSLMDLPEKLHLAIAANMRLNTRERLRKVSRYFRTTIPAPTHAELLAAEKEEWSHSYWHLLACGGCLRLRNEQKFAPQKKYGYRNLHEEKEFEPRMGRGGAFAHVRFCNDCGVRPLPGTFRYMLGEHWSDEEKKRPAARCERCWLEMGTAIDYVRCKKCDPCDNIKEAPHCMHVGLCVEHYDEEKKVRKPNQKEEKQSSLSAINQNQVSNPDFLTTLDLDVLALVVTQLGPDDQMILRGVCTFFNEFIPRFIHEDLLEVELEEWAISSSLLACGGCVRLRHQSKFGYRVVYGDDWQFGGWIVPYRGGENAKKRYCNDCGIRDLPGDYRYPEGAHWLYDEEGNPEAEFVRCKESCCGDLTQPPEGIYWGIGEGCYERGSCLNCTPYPNTALDEKFLKHFFKIKQYFGRPFITSLPAELILSIAENLRLDELMLLRGVSRFFYNVIPAPTHQQLLVAETEDWAITLKHNHQLLACGGCQRLRRDHKFNSRFFSHYTSRGQLFYPGLEPGGPRAAERFCNTCGIRKLPGDFRYWPGAHFSNDEEDPYCETLVRCKRCGLDRSPPSRPVKSGHIEVGICEPCYVEMHGRTRISKDTHRLSKIEGLSAELIHAIIRHLEFPDRQALRLVSHNLKYDVPRPTHHQLFLAEQEDWAISKGLLSCGGCVRLRHDAKFNSRLITEDTISDENNVYAELHRGGPRGHRRFCNECGIRPLPGKYRYQLGYHWYDQEKDRHIVRCKMCKLDKESPGGVEKGLCAACWDAVEDDELSDSWGLHTVEICW